MIGSLITMIIFLWAFSLGFGVLLAKLLWTPPGQDKGINNEVKTIR